MPSTITRRKTREISIGNVKIGGGAPVIIQSMTNTFTQDIDATVSQIKRLEAAGCEVIRVAIPDDEAAGAISSIKKKISIPVIADIHFDYRLAISSIKAGADGLRINPGNIGSKKRVKEIVACAKDFDIPIRIGVNSGSVEKELLKKYKEASPEAMAESAFRHVDFLKSLDFHKIKVSLKASDVHRTVTACKIFSAKSDMPMHVGVTEAGTMYAGIVKSALGIGMLLMEGIGDTIRVSLTSDPVDEVRVGYEILKALGIRQRGVEIISCPTCGRCNIDLFAIVKEVEEALLSRTAPLKIAIMGCIVNGPGEAKEADIGIAGGDGKGILFKKGRVIKKIPEEKLVEVLLEEIRKL